VNASLLIAKQVRLWYRRFKHLKRLEDMVLLNLKKSKENQVDYDDHESSMIESLASNISYAIVD
jgi:hypothetical protein